MTQKLQELIYKYNNVIVIKSKNISDIVTEIESVRNGSSIEGYIFRPAFASSIEFKEYTVEDWMAIYAQWSISFGWSDIFQEITETNPNSLLDDYLATSNTDNLFPLITEEKAPIVKREKYLLELACNLMQSKTVLTSHQKEILDNITLSILKKAYSSSVVTIKEIRTMLVSKILAKDKMFNPFNSISDIIPILIEGYSIKGTFNLEEGQMLNKVILSNVKIKIPTSLKRKVILTLIDGYQTKYGIENLKKYQNFWKKVFRQVLIKNSFEKTVNTYPEFKNVHSLVYSNIVTDRTKIEEYRKIGLLKEAFTIEMNNTGSMLRNILFYLRNNVGDTYPIKEEEREISIPFFGASIKMNNVYLENVPFKSMKGKTTVKSDISEILDSSEFYNVLERANPKLLVQLKALISEKKYTDVITYRKVGLKNINYEEGIPALNKDWVVKLTILIDKAYHSIKVKANKELGKVFISDYYKGIKTNFSGRMDVSTNTSGEFLPIGSKIIVDKLLEKDVIVRYGVSWRSPADNKNLSICIDPSLHITNGKMKDSIINYKNPTLRKGSNILVSSSGDITVCSPNKWSTELIDIDVDALKKFNSTEMFTAAINYSAPQGDLSEVETYIFVNVIKRKDRIIDGRKVEVKLDEMDYSYQINEKSQAQIGLRFDLEKGEIEVLKINEGSVPSCSYASRLHNKFMKSIVDAPELPFIYDALKNALSSDNIVSSEEEADIIIDKDYDFTKIQNILF